MAVTSVQVISVPVSDQERAKNFYVERLGFRRFLQALSSLNVDAMFAELDADVVCEFPTGPDGGPRRIEGWDANREFFTAIRPMWPAFQLTRIALHPLADDPQRVLAEFASEGSLLDGSAYANTYLALGTVRMNKIVHWREFSDPAPIARGGAALQQALLDRQ